MKLQQRNIKGQEANLEAFDYIPKDPVSGNPLVDEEGGPMFRVRPMGRAEYFQIVKKAEKPVIDPRTRGVILEVDSQAVSDEVLRRVLLGWNDAIVDCDGTPIPCTDDTKLMIDGRFLDQVKVAAMGAEVVVGVAASFRSPA
jgi:hypothetical protein